MSRAGPTQPNSPSPARPPLSNHLVNAAKLLDQGQAAAARTLIQQTLRSEPGNPWANQLMRHAMTRLGEMEAALYYAQKASRLSPGDPDVANNLAVSLANVGRAEEARGVLEASLEKHPLHPMNQAALAGVHAAAGRFPAAMEVCQKAIERGLPAPAVLGPTVASMMNLGMADQAAMLLRAAVGNESGNPMLLSALCSALPLAPLISAADLVGAHHAFGRLLVRQMPRHNELKADTADSGRPLRVGVVVGAADPLMVECQLAPMIAALGGAGCVLRVYLAAPIDAGGVERLRVASGSAPADAFAQSPAKLNERMLGDRLDVVIDAASHTAPQALLALHMRGAPVQIAALAHPISSGVQTMDGRLSDADSDPEEGGKPGGNAGGERVLRLERPATVFVPAAGSGPVGVCPSASSSDGSVTFGALASAPRLNEGLVRMWAGLVRQLPGARLLVQNGTLGEESCRAHLSRRFEQAGLSPSRLELVGPVTSVAERDALHGKIDIGLDAPPLASGLETACAVHMGVPVVTLAGLTAGRRGSVGVLRAAGLEDLIASTEDGYAEAAIGLARDSGRRERLRASLRGKLAASALCDVKGYGSALEAALRRVWLAA